jgi:CheY-like chemotaxis protein
VDIKLPGMDGYEVMTAIREKPEFAQLPIIARTGKAPTVSETAASRPEPPTSSPNRSACRAPRSDRDVDGATQPRGRTR